MTTVAFDTLAFVKKLEDRGIKPDHAEGIIEIMKDAFSNADIATKAEIREFEAKTKMEMTTQATRTDLEKVKVEVEKVRAEVEKVRLEVANAKAEILKWYVGIAAVQLIGLGFLILRALGKS